MDDTVGRGTTEKRETAGTRDSGAADSTRPVEAAHPRQSGPSAVDTVEAGPPRQSGASAVATMPAGAADVPRDLRDWIARAEALGQIVRVRDRVSRDEMGA